MSLHSTIKDHTSTKLSNIQSVHKLYVGLLLLSRKNGEMCPLKPRQYQEGLCPLAEEL